MKFLRACFLILVVLVISLGCNLPAILADPTTTPLPPAPQEIEPVEQPGEALPPPTTTVEIPPTPTDTQPPPPPAAQINPFAPAGFGVGSTTNETLTFLDVQGQSLGTIPVPGLSYADPSHVHIAGPYHGNLLDVPVIYHVFGNIGNLKQSVGGNSDFIVTAIDVSEMSGAPGQFALVYSEVTWGGDALSTYLYMRSISGGGASWFWERTDPMSWAIYPLAVEATHGELDGLLFTLKPWGIGGDIVFPPQKGLFYLDMQTLQHSLILTESFNPIGISSDQNMVAYVNTDNGFVEGANNRLTIYDLQATTTLPINLDPSSERGAGYAVFSPDNHFIAWMEGSGWQMAEVPNFTSRVRIADTDGNLYADIPASTFASAAGDPSVRHAIPVGWIDGEHLLVEALGSEWNNPALIRVRYDGSNPTRIAQGNFIGFLYP